jgi:hypothetical protein
MARTSSLGGPGFFYTPPHTPAPLNAFLTVGSGIANPPPILCCFQLADGRMFSRPGFLQARPPQSLSHSLLESSALHSLFLRRAGYCSLFVIGLVIRREATAATYSSGVKVANFSYDQFTEISGMVASRNNSGVLWMHNDSGDSARIFAANTAGQYLGTYTVPSGVNTDWEDIAIGPGPVAGVDYLYIGDIGDNDENRATIDIYRVPEPAVYGRQSSAPVLDSLNGSQRLRLVYPNGARNAESMIVDPISGDLLLFTKSSTSQVYKATAAQLAAGGTQTLSFVRNVNFSKPSAAAISNTGSEIMIRHENAASVWNRLPGETVEQALARSFAVAPIVGEPQEANGEAVTFDALGNGYYTTSEQLGAPLHYFDRTDSGKHAAPTTLVAAGSAWKFADDGQDRGTAWRVPSYNDSAWRTGNGQFGYGDGDEFTTINYGPSAANKFVTTYFRTTFNVVDPDEFDQLILTLIADDGVAVYLNGEELLRKNLPSGALHNTLAQAIDSGLEATWFRYQLPADLLRAGINTLAVEVHQAAPDSSDLSFDLQLHAVPEPATIALMSTAMGGTGILLAARRWKSSRNRCGQ